jgi:hypothetical protein
LWALRHQRHISDVAAVTNSHCKLVTVPLETAKIRNPCYLASAMLAKLTSKNQLTLPKAAVTAVGATEYFDVEVHQGQIVLTPVRIQRGDAVRAKLAELGLTGSDVADAVSWARGSAAAHAVAEPQPGYNSSGGRAARKTPAKKTASRRK